MENMRKVSVIIPAYNVGAYVDQCLESVCTQTYQELEIIIVYDKGDDGTLEICREWEMKDSRIRVVVNEKRRGLGEARNIGLRLAVGEYIMYLDPDDWYTPECAEKLVAALEETDADYVSYCGIFLHEEGQTGLKRMLPAGTYSSVAEKSVILLQEFPAVWKKIYRRQWLIENHLFQPRLFHYEDWGYNMFFVPKASRIVLITGAGVHHRSGRPGSLSMDSALSLVQDFGKAAREGIERMAQGGELEQYKKVFLMYFLDNYRMWKKKSSDQQNQEILDLLEEIWNDIAVELLGYRHMPAFRRHIAFGSFSSRWVLDATRVFSENMEYYGFSSLIAAMTQAEATEVYHEREFRKYQTEQDIEGKFAKKLEGLNEKTLLVLDFMEERHAVILGNEHNYYTESEAFREASGHGLLPEKMIEPASDLFYHLWKQKCTEFVDILEQKGDILDTVLLKNRLSLKYGNMDRREEFDGTEEIRTANERIECLEQIFLNICKEKGVPVTVMEQPEKYSFTDDEFKYGCEPQYMNQILYNCMAMELVSKYM